MNEFDLVIKSVKELLKNDVELLERKVNERSIAFRLGYYVQRNMYKMRHVYKSHLVVDAEYDKNGNGNKGVYGICRYNTCKESNSCHIKTSVKKYKIKGRIICRSDGMRTICKQVYSRLSEYVQSTKDSKYMIPDLLIHERNKKGNISDNKEGSINNLVAIEIKKFGTENSIAVDLAKLTYLTCSYAEYKFKLGLHLNFEVNNDRITCYYRKFINGLLVHEDRVN